MVRHVSREYSEKYYKENQERLKLLQNLYYSIHREKINEKNKIRKIIDPEFKEKKRKIAIDFYYKNRERILAKMKAQREKDPEKYNEQNRHRYYSDWKRIRELKNRNARALHKKRLEERKKQMLLPDKREKLMLLIYKVDEVDKNADQGNIREQADSSTSGREELRQDEQPVQPAKELPAVQQ